MIILYIMYIVLYYFQLNMLYYVNSIYLGIPTGETWDLGKSHFFFLLISPKKKKNSDHVQRNNVS